MREIKFRAWNTQENKMLYRSLFDMNWYETDKNDSKGCHTWGAISGGQRKFLEIMRFTGLKNKNGVEIYEGDIVTINFGNDEKGRIKDIWVVKFGKHENDWVSHSAESGGTIEVIGFYLYGKYGTERFYNLVEDIEKIEILGNIYQHKDLLN